MADKRNDGRDLKKLLMAYLRNGRRILLCGLALAAAMGIGALLLEGPQYEATVTVYVNNSADSRQEDYLTESNLTASRRLVNTYLSIVESQRVLEKAAAQLGGYTVKELREMVSAAQIRETELFEISVVSPDPQEAARVANVLAEVAPGEIAAVIAGSSAHIVDEARVPEEPCAPNYKMLLLVGAVLGWILALVWVTLLELLDDRIRDTDDLTAVSDAPVLGRIPAACKSAESERDAEEWKLLRTNVLFSLPEEERRPVVMVTSPNRGEGKSRTALQLARALAQTERRVLLIDCDLRHSGLAAQSGSGEKAGLIEVLADPKALVQAVVKGCPDVLPAGGTPSNPSELLASSAMGELLERLKGQYDAIVLDVPAVNEAADAAVLAQRCDGVLLVVRAGQTRRDEVQSAAEQISFARGRLLGVVLHDLKKKERSRRR